MRRPIVATPRSRRVVVMSKPGVILPDSAPDDLVIEEITIGDGPEASAGNLVEVH